MEENQQPDWTIGTLYEKAWQIVKKNKVLWILGMAVASATSSGSGNINLPGEMFQQPETTQKSTEAANVLGAAASSPFQEILNATSPLFANIPPYFYIFFGLNMLFLLVYVIVLFVVYKAWADGSLLHGIELAKEGKSVSIRESSERAFGSLKSLIWLNTIPGLVFTIVILLFFGIFAFTVLKTDGIVRLITVIASAIFMIGLLVSAILLSITQIWAPRQVVIDKKPAKKAFLDAFTITLRKFWASVLLGIVNMVLSFFLIGVPVLLFFGVFIFLGFATNGNTVIFPLTIGLIAIAMFTLIIGLSVVIAAFTSFKGTVWSLAYHAIRGKYDK